MHLWQARGSSLHYSSLCHCPASLSEPWLLWWGRESLLPEWQSAASLAAYPCYCVRRWRLSFPLSFMKSTTFFSPFTTSPATSTPRPTQRGKNPWRPQVRLWWKIDCSAVCLLWLAKPTIYSSCVCVFYSGVLLAASPQRRSLVISRVQHPRLL